MRNKPWAVTAPLLLTGILVGCNGTNRFSREQYASLASDPFLMAESHADTAAGGSSGIMTASATADSNTEFGAVKNAHHQQESCDSACSIGSSGSAASRPQPSNAVAGAAPNVDFGSRQTPVHPAPSAASEAASGFDAWIQQNGNKVQQAAAGVREQTVQSFGSVAADVRQVAFSEFPGEKPNFDEPAPVPEQNTMEENPFAQMDAFSSQSASAAPVADPDVFSPPTGFEFPAE